MAAHRPEFELRLAAGEADIRAAQRLRYEVFVEELGGDGALVDHAARLERDAFDAHYDHLLLFDRARPGDAAIGVYRLMRDDMVHRVGRYYSESEYDLGVLKASGRRLLELGRSCVHPDYRGGAALMQLWRGLLGYVECHGIEVMFGVASFHGSDPAPLAQPLSLLHHRHLAPPALRVRALPEHFQRMDLVPEAEIDRVAAMRAVPALIKAYLRLGGFVGEGAFIDAPFNTTDVCVVVDIARVPDSVRAIYAREDPT
ncbi:GNAT family N-acetyltransferase [Sinisalibacter lacisalsi]|uniref:L-ornithine N(alpha)-acyltransferase n=1 Tax=Sinisalibacter lacisalsi TaxID=1526570 RepID=A0ABQ1QN59_9RHOB|nr:GNAT family N-acyltransferase [Sinisalibacter lacisalsi]GGD32785.1 ornithine-acyl-ACP acyltransferase [Sinisalibacter lacisalsi]